MDVSPRSGSRLSRWRGYRPKRMAHIHLRRMIRHMASDASAATGNTGTRRPLRRDAEQNRRRIIRAAQEIFAANGLGAGLNDIAHHAGVGVGTVYRRFPDKAALIREALQNDVELLLEVADEALATEPAWDGLMLLIKHVADLLVANLGLRDVALGPGQLSSEFDEIADQVRHYVEELLQRAQVEGSVRHGVRSDVELLLEVADEALATEPAWDGLMLLIKHVADLLVANLGLRDVALGPGQLSSEFDEIADQVRHYVEELLQRAQVEGSVRHGVTPQDFTML